VAAAGLRSAPGAGRRRRGRRRSRGTARRGRAAVR
jgi:hypothetical protein